MSTSEKADAAAAVKNDGGADEGNEGDESSFGKGKEKVDHEVPIAGGSNGHGSGGKFIRYPAPLAKYDDVIADPQLFKAALENLHTLMGTKFMVPVIGGRELDLHQLFKEVTSRGGIDKVKADNRWREVTASFSFPSTATNASFVLRKYYLSLLHHFEQIYFFGAQGWYQPETAPQAASFVEPKAEAQASSQKRKRKSSASPPDPSSLSDNTQAVVVIDGKFETGYFVTVILRSKRFKGVLYHCADQSTVPPPVNPVMANNCNLRGGRRHRRRKKLSKRDPRHPKPNRSGYNFFFRDQHRRLKPLHPGQDRLISKMIGQLWNNLTAAEKAVYQERGAKDRERYQSELAAYKEELRTGQPISSAVPIQQRFPEPEVTIDEVDSKVNEGDLLLLNQNGSSSDEIDDSGGKTPDEDSETETSPERSQEATDSAGLVDPLTDGDHFELRRRENTQAKNEQNASGMIGDESKGIAKAPMGKQ